MTSGRSGKYKITPEQLIEAIHDTYGIKCEIARRAGVSRQAVANYLRNEHFAEALAVYLDERERSIDDSEGIVLHNIRVARQYQLDNPDKMIDSGDAKWFLTMRGRERGYSSTQRHEVQVDEKPHVLLDTE